MSFFHVTNKQYRINDIVDATTFESTEYHQQTIQKGMSDIDNILDMSRPKDFPSRKNCIYAFDNIGMCMHFVGNRYDGNEIYYEVEMIKPVKCPMKLIKILNEENYTVNQQIIIDEYWQPNLENEWKYFEYLASSMEIISIIDGNDRMGKITAGMFNNSDEELATKLFIK